MRIKRLARWEEFYAALGHIPERLKTPVPLVVEAVPLFRHHRIQD